MAPSTAGVRLKLADVPAYRGAQWFVLGWRVFGQRPLAFSGLFAFFLFVALVVLLLPWIGPLVMLAMLPLLTLGFMIATREALAARFPMPGVFVVPLTGDPGRRRALIGLGLLYAAGGVVIMLLSDAIDGGAFDELQRVMVSDREEDRARVEELLTDPRLRTGLFARLLLTTLIAVPFWHAPALVHWAGQGVGQALFSSTIAVWHCRGAFIFYTFAWSAAVAAFGALVGLLGAMSGARALFTLLALPAGLVFSTAFYASLYFTYADSFSTDDGAAAAAPPTLPPA